MTTTKHFSVRHKRYRTKTHIQLQMLHDAESTKDIPHTYDLLEANLPSILHSKCFNPKNLTFADEVRETEWGHLFEHILLEYLCLEKMKAGADSANFDGETAWDIENTKDFFITISAGSIDEEVLHRGLQKTIDLFHDIFETKKQVAPMPPASA